MFSVKDAILTSESEIWGTSDFFAPPLKQAYLGIWDLRP